MYQKQYLSRQDADPPCPSDKAKSDGPNMLYLHDLEMVVKSLL